MQIKDNLVITILFSLIAFMLMRKFVWCCASLITMLALLRILCHKSFYKDCFTKSYKHSDRHVNKSIMTFIKLHWSFCCNYNFLFRYEHPTKNIFNYASIILCLMLSKTYYAWNYAGIIGLWGVSMNPPVWLVFT